VKAELTPRQVLEMIHEKLAAKAKSD
jgi:hypothetical protein